MPYNHSRQVTNILAHFKAQQKCWPEFRSEPIQNRKTRLRKLRDWIHHNRIAIHEAMYSDFKKPALEVDGTELFHVLNEIKHALAHLDDWARPKAVKTPITMLGTTASVHAEPKGICLIISPWNYPFSLAVGPLVSALAAGNTAILKPSELTPNVSALLERMITALYPADEVVVINGDAAVAAELIQLPFDHIFFTGSPRVGKLVMKAAAENLTSVTLELGGKSPAIVTAKTDLKEAAKRIAVAKFINNGQTCIAPDYILAEQSIISDLTNALREQVDNLFADNGPLENSQSYARIVNEHHYNRIQKLVDDAVSRGAKVSRNGPSNSAERFMHPVIMTDVPNDALILEEEIFGPVLPVVAYSNINDTVAYINKHPKPLALYIFGADQAEEKLLLHNTSAGGVCINDCAIHFLNHNLPFGGVNNSGIGKSHGFYGFLAFSNEKSVLKQKSGFTSVQPFYPPYNQATKRLMDWFLKLF
ncbi:MAG TPA: aldehyde dehydrogenase family protein [Ohtaekwangia sp.]|nr:aldehyde dehydrogenase family protein [Ohtaekwangia sp.]